jgi:hypothetical protein
MDTTNEAQIVIKKYLVAILSSCSLSSAISVDTVDKHPKYLERSVRFEKRRNEWCPNITAKPLLNDQ